MGNNGVGIEMVIEVITKGKIDPLSLFDHGAPICTRLNDLELICRADTTSEEELWSPEGSRGYDNAAYRIPMSVYSPDRWCSKTIEPEKEEFLAQHLKIAQKLDVNKRQIVPVPGVRLTVPARPPLFVAMTSRLTA